MKESSGGLQRGMVTAVTSDGRGIVRSQDGVVFVEGALPCEEILYRVVERRKSWSEAELVKVAAPSNGRRKPLCRHASDCGGCRFQHARYDLQLSMKRGMLRDALVRLGGPRTRSELQRLPEVAVAPSPVEFGYRCRFTVRVDRRGRVGFEARRGRRFVPVEECPVLDETCSGVLSLLLEAPPPPDLIYSIRAISDAVGGFGLSLYVRSAGEKLAAWCAEMRLRAGRKGLRFKSLQIRTQHTAGSSTTQQGGRRNQRRAGAHPACLSSLVEKPMERPHLNGCSLRFLPSSFMQANPAVNELLVRRLEELARKYQASGRTEGTSALLLDLFGGNGNLSLPLLASGTAESVVIVDSDAKALELALAEAQRKGLAAKVECIEDNLFSPRWRPPAIHPGTAVVLDPPREGAMHVCRLLAEPEAPAPRALFYVSCNPATLARDLETLLRRYRLETLEAFDMMPQTAHMEALAVLVPRRS